MQSRKTEGRFALKKTKKANLITRKGFEMIRNEREITEKVRSEFTANMIMGFQDKNYVYSLM